MRITVIIVVAGSLLGMLGVFVVDWWQRGVEVLKDACSFQYMEGT
jgi:hypothetical protein